MTVERSEPTEAWTFRTCSWIDDLRGNALPIMSGMGAQRIGERLDNASVSVTGEVKHDGRLLPVLAASCQAADELADRLFPSTVPRSVAVSDGAGWGAGRAAADLAALDFRGVIAG
ncbi:MAG TPA: hypothetical protein VFR27_10685 [Mycobacterium sp.]|nr:hypothetical protein [Mycobacterium sp.]